MTREPSRDDGILNVLLVDDDPDHRWLTRDAISLTDRPCCIHEAASAEEALAMLTGAEGRCERLNPDVIYLDVEMPGMGGLVLLSRIRSDPLLQGIMVVMVTGSGEISRQRQERIRNDADGLIICTEWMEFRNPDFARMKALLRRPIIVDGRNLYSPKKMLELGFRYVSVGRPVVT